MSGVPGFVYADDLIRQANKIEKDVAARARRATRSNVFWKLVAAILTLIVVTLSITLAYTVPNIRLLPVLLYTTPEGMTGAALTTESLPGDLPTASIQAWLWQYVMHRESYAWVEMDYNHLVVEAMSSNTVREAYDAWSNGKNPQSYMATYRDDVLIRTSWVETTQWLPPSQSTPGTVTFHFKRAFIRKAAPQHPIVSDYSVTMRFLTGYQGGMNAHDVLTFNPSRIVVVDYPPPQEMTPMPGTTQ